MTILALDLGTTTGWASRNQGGAIASGICRWMFDGKHDGRGFVQFRAWLHNRAIHCERLVFEDALFQRGAAATRFLGLRAITQMVAEELMLPYQGVPVGTIKRHIAGKGNADKQAVIDAVRRLGFNPADDNEADALALLDWAIASHRGNEIETERCAALRLHERNGIDRRGAAHLRVSHERKDERCDIGSTGRLQWMRSYAMDARTGEQ